MLQPMKDKRSLIRLDVKDFISIRPLDEVAKHSVEGQTQDITFIGICFISQAQWKKGQVLLIEYFIPGESEAVNLKVVIIWSEFVSSQEGYFSGGEIYDMEGENQESFVRYYFEKLREKYHQ